jgi:hypothetical protein
LTCRAIWPTANRSDDSDRNGKSLGNASESETDESRGDIGEIPRQEPKTAPPENLLERFRECAKALAQPLHSWRRKRRRSESEASGFALAANNLTRRTKIKRVIERVIDIVVDRAIDYLAPASWDLLEWLHLWEPQTHHSDLLDVQESSMNAYVHEHVPSEFSVPTSDFSPEPRP